AGTGLWGDRDAGRRGLAVPRRHRRGVRSARRRAPAARDGRARAGVNLVRVDPEHPDDGVLLEAAEAVLRGGVIAFPTDTLYGLGCSLFDVSAVEMVARLKRRDPSLAVISLIPEPRQVYGLARDVGDVATRLMQRF